MSAWQTDFKLYEIMNYAEIKKNDIANGEGVRTSLFVSGCRHHCKNCFNQTTWDFNCGRPFDENTQADIISSCKPDWISGLSLLGGEPFEPENQSALLSFLKKFRELLPDKTIWCYTGFLFEEITGQKMSRAFTDISIQLLGYIDVLVDGPFVEEKRIYRLSFAAHTIRELLMSKEHWQTRKQKYMY